MALTGPLLSALRPVSGSISVVAARALLVMASGLAPALVARSLVRSGPGLMPSVVDAARPLPVFQLLDVLGSLRAVVPVAVMAVVLAVLADLFVTAGAIAVLQQGGSRASAFRIGARAARDFLWPLVRISGVALVAAAALSAVIGAATYGLVERGYAAGWSALTMFVWIPAAATLMGYLALTTVGCWVMWVRVVTVVDSTATLWRTSGLVWQIWRRRPLQTVGFFVGLTAFERLSSGVLLVAWRQFPPSSATALAVYSVLWVVTIALGAYGWHWAIRATLGIYGLPDFDKLRAVS